MKVRHLLILFTKHVLDALAHLYLVLEERPALNFGPGKPCDQTLILSVCIISV